MDLKDFKLSRNLHLCKISTIFAKSNYKQLKL